MLTNNLKTLFCNYRFCWIFSIK